jgi:hypothetical protein
MGRDHRRVPSVRLTPGAAADAFAKAAVLAGMIVLINTAWLVDGASFAPLLRREIGSRMLATSNAALRSLGNLGSRRSAGDLLEEPEASRLLDDRRPALVERVEHAFPECGELLRLTCRLRLRNVKPTAVAVNWHDNAARERADSER